MLKMKSNYWATKNRDRSMKIMIRKQNEREEAGEMGFDLIVYNTENKWKWHPFEPHFLFSFWKYGEYFVEIFIFV